jgi:hypothetical protein
MTMTREICMSLDIPSDAQPLIEKRVEKLNRKSDKLGLGQFISVAFSAPFIYEKKDASGRTVRATEQVKVSVFGDMPNIDGWSFVATLAHDEGRENLLLRMPGSDESIDLIQYANADPSICEHCNTRRARKDTYIIADENGQTMQVGGTCLKDFLGHDNPLAYARLQGSLHGIFHGLGSGEPLEDTREFVVHAATVIRVHGFKPAGYGPSSTRSLADVNREGFTENTHFVAPTAADEDLADQALSWIRDLDRTDKGEFIHNLYAAASLSHMHRRHEGLLAALIPTYIKETQSKVATPKASEHVGVVGQPLEVEFTVKSVSSFPSQYGYGKTAHKHVLKTTDGDTLIWYRNSGEPLEKGVTYQASFIVKKHDIHAIYGNQTHVKNAKDIVC